jgi:hypothetical protein
LQDLTSASGLRAIDKTLDGVEDKSKAIIARFDIGVVLLVHRERGGSSELEKPRLNRVSLTFFRIVA